MAHLVDLKVWIRREERRQCAQLTAIDINLAGISMCQSYVL